MVQEVGVGDSVDGCVDGYGEEDDGCDVRESARLEV